MQTCPRENMNKIYPYIDVLIRFIIGAIFIWASYDKIIDPGKFAREISNYRIVTFGLENTIAITLPWIELFIGFGLIAGLYINANSFIAGVLLLLFNILVFQAMVRGFNIECGCGLKEGQMVGYGKLFENFLLFAGCVFVLKTKEHTMYVEKFQ